MKHHNNPINPLSAAFSAVEGNLPAAGRLPKYWMDSFSSPQTGQMACWGALGHLIGVPGQAPTGFVPVAVTEIPRKGRISHLAFRGGEWESGDTRAVLATPGLLDAPSFPEVEVSEAVILRVAYEVREREGVHQPTFHVRRWNARCPALGIAGFSRRVEAIRPVAVWIPSMGSNPQTALRLRAACAAAPWGPPVYEAVRSQMTTGASQEEAEAIMPATPTAIGMVRSLEAYQPHYIRTKWGAGGDMAVAEAGYKSMANAHHPRVEEALEYIRNARPQGQAVRA
jgi:hypothetical protein